MPALGITGSFIPTQVFLVLLMSLASNFKIYPVADSGLNKQPQEQASAFDGAPVLHLIPRCFALRTPGTVLPLPRRSRNDKLNGEKATRIWRLVRLSPLRSAFTVRVCEKASFFNFSQPAGDAGCPQS